MDERLEQIFFEASERETAERGVFLEQACGGDERLRAELESLLEDHVDAELRLQGAIRTMADALLPGAGERVGPYRLVRGIGEGGMGTVFLAERVDGEFEQQVAIKFVSGGPLVTSRFLLERQILARLVHPNIARLLDGGVTDDGTPYMVMEYFPGQPLTEYCADHNLGVNQKLRLFQQVCAAVEYAHQNLVVHRDLKPSNILVNQQGELKLLDFGIAKLLEQSPEEALTVAGAHFFTADYASPEQVQGEPVTTATDIYSLGAVLFELLKGEGPHRLQSYSPAEITQVICLDPAPDLGLGNELDNIVQVALRKEPERRYRSVAQLGEDVQRFLEHRPVQAKADTRLYRVRKFVRRNAWSVSAAVLAILGLTGGLAVAAWQANIARQEAQQAQRRFQQVRNLARTMLFDMDAKIRNLTGATEAREFLVKTSLEYLDNLRREAASDAGLQRELATGYERIADVQGEPGRPNLGQRANANRSYRRAAELWESAPESERDWMAMARVYLKLHDVDGGELWLQKGVDAARVAEQRASGTAAAFEIQVRALRASGNYANNRLLGEEALRDYRKALAVAQQWRTHMPGDEAEQAAASALASIADASLRMGHPEGALRAVDEMVTIRARLLAADPHNPNHARQLYKAHMVRGHAYGNPLYIHLHRPEDARQSYEQALPIAKRLLELDPKNRLAQSDVAGVYWALGITLTQSQPREARQFQNEALERLLAIQQSSPKTLVYIQDVANSYCSLAEIAVRLGDRQMAARHLAEAIERYRTVAKARPKQIGLRHNLLPPLTLQLHLQVMGRDGNGAAGTVTELIGIMQTVERNGSYRSKIPNLAAAHSAIARFHAMRGNPEAAVWRHKSVALWEELAKYPGSRTYAQRMRDQERMGSLPPANKPRIFSRLSVDSRTAHSMVPQ